MSNVTYLPWVTPEPESVQRLEPVPETPEDDTDLIGDDDLARLDTLVVRKLAARDMSRGEVRTLLIQQGLPDLDALRWVERYERLGYVSDERLARLIVTTWHDRKGRGHGAIAAEMRRRKIDVGVCSRVLSEVDSSDELERAIDVARERLRRVGKLDREAAERRLVGFLSRRGFSGGIVRVAVRTAFEEPLDTR